MAGKKPQSQQPRASIGFYDGYGYALPPGQTIGWQYVYCAGYEVDEKGEKHFHHFENIPCQCKPGPMAMALSSPAFETALLGGRGSMKTETVFGFLSKGNDGNQGNGDTDVSYLHDPEYTFLVLRKNSTDLDDFFRRAKQFFGMFGGVATENPFKIRFPSGAEGDFAHLQDESAFEKHQGKTYTRIALEEAGHIASELLYMRTIMSCRSKHKRLNPQVMLTANPGGPGNRWLKGRFIDTIKPSGKKIKPSELYTCPLTQMTRGYVHSTVYDNPYFMRDNAQYVRQLEMLPPVERERWLMGNFGITEGQFFESFREEPRPGEPANACHVLKCTKERPAPVELLDYWPRSIGVDWGFSHNSVAAWGCWHPKGQLHIYRELSLSRKGTVELGAEIALKSLPDLERMPQQHMVVYLSPDAFARTDDTQTEAEQIARGIGTVLGRDAAFVLAPTQEESSMDQADAWASMMRRQKEFSGKTHLTIVRANNARKAGWNLIREYLRWWPLVGTRRLYNVETAKEILLKQGAMAHRDYEEATKEKEFEILPKMQIWSACPTISKGLEEAIEKETDTEDVQKTNTPGDDGIDALRYLCMGFTFSEAEKPRGIYIADKVAGIRGLNPGMDINALVMANRFAEAEYDKQHSVGAKGFSIARKAGPTSRRMRVN